MDHLVLVIILFFYFIFHSERFCTKTSQVLKASKVQPNKQKTCFLYSFLLRTISAITSISAYTMSKLPHECGVNNPIQHFLLLNCLLAQQPATMQANVFTTCSVRKAKLSMNQLFVESPLKWPRPTGLFPLGCESLRIRLLMNELPQRVMMTLDDSLDTLRSSGVLERPTATVWEPAEPLLSSGRSWKKKNEKPPQKRFKGNQENSPSFCECILPLLRVTHLLFLHGHKNKHPTAKTIIHCETSPWSPEQQTLHLELLSKICSLKCQVYLLQSSSDPLSCCCCCFFFFPQ